MKPAFFIILWFCFHLSCVNKIALERVNPVVNKVSVPGVRMVRPAAYRMLPGDVVEVKLVYHPKYTERMHVRPDGMISLPVAGEVMCAGKTPLELRKSLIPLYERELNDPDVSVIIRHFEGRVVYVGGAVRSPMVMKVAFPATLLQSVVYCGDLIPGANDKEVLVLRTGIDGRGEVFTVDLKSIREGVLPDFPLEPQDVVHVPKKDIVAAGEYVELYINAILPRNVSFPFTYELHDDEN